MKNRCGASLCFGGGASPSAQLYGSTGLTDMSLNHWFNEKAQLGVYDICNGQSGGGLGPPQRTPGRDVWGWCQPKPVSEHVVVRQRMRPPPSEVVTDIREPLRSLKR